MHSPALRPRERVAEARWRDAPVESTQPIDTKPRGLLQGVRVLDFSNIIAGPAAGRTLAEHGADVTRIDSPAPMAGPRTTVWFGVDVNQGKRTIIVDLKTESGREILARRRLDGVPEDQVAHDVEAPLPRVSLHVLESMDRRRDLRHVLFTQ